MKTNPQEFLLELKALLEKHNANIQFNVGESSDTHGLYDEHMTITVRQKDHPWKDVNILRVDGWGISAYDIDLADYEQVPTT